MIDKYDGAYGLIDTMVINHMLKNFDNTIIKEILRKEDDLKYNEFIEYTLF